MGVELERAVTLLQVVTWRPLCRYVDTPKGQGIRSFNVIFEVYTEEWQDRALERVKEMGVLNSFAPKSRQYKETEMRAYGKVAVFVQQGTDHTENTDPALVATMASRAASVPVTHGMALYVGGDDREVLCKTLRNCAFNRRSTTKATSPSQAPRRALSVPLTSNNDRMKLARPANFQNFDASALEHPDANPTGPRAPSNVVGTGLSNSSDFAEETTGSLPTVSEVDQEPSFHQRPFPKGTGTGETRWFRSSSAHQLLCPNEDVAGAVGDLYIHTNIRSRLTYVWVLHPDEGWVSIEPGGNHPTVPKRRLRIRKDGDPSWVQLCHPASIPM
ncbi:hypothetical protein BD769DRAFT_1384027 [Suillus cothurnatus]|nr:hypothetical protein BD769DRAFT_1384027 [Suillus cothurnatus]